MKAQLEERTAIRVSPLNCHQRFFQSAKNKHFRNDPKKIKEKC